MDIDTLFSILFVVVIILFQGVGMMLKKRKSRRPEAAGETSAGPKKGFLQTVVNRIQEEMEQARQAAQSPASGPSAGWEQFMKTPAREKAEPERAPAAATGRGNATFAGDRTGPASSRVTLSAAEAGLEEIDLDENFSAEPPPPAKKNPSSAILQRPSGKHSPDIHELRRAVIWSEILAPPLALRRED